MLTALSPSLDERLFTASERGDLREVRRLVEESKVKVDTVKAGVGWTALMFASKAGSLSVVEYLVQERHADVNATSTRGRTTPVHEAALYGHLQVVKFLVRHGADPIVPDADLSTPLHKAAFKGHLDVVVFLVYKTPASVHARDKKGWTPWHSASYDSHEECMVFLKRLLDTQPVPEYLKEGSTVPPPKPTPMSMAAAASDDEEEDDAPPPPPDQPPPEEDIQIPQPMLDFMQTVDLPQDVKQEYQVLIVKGGYETEPRIKRLNAQTLRQMGINTTEHLQKLLQAVRNM